jgi:hypothetical protein
MFDEPEAAPPKKRKARKKNSVFRTRPASAAVNPQRQPLNLEPETPAMRKRRDAEMRRSAVRWVVGLVIMVALGVLGHAAVEETLLSNPRFTLKQVFVETKGMLTPQQICRATELPDGVNLLTVNLADVRTRLLNLPAVSAAEVARDFEGKLTIKVRQREPVAWVQCERLRYLPKTSGRGLLVDGQGYAIPAETVLSEFDALPIIVDESIDQVSPGAIIETPRFKSALSLLSLLKGREAANGTTLLSIAMPNDFALEAKLAGGACIVFGYNNMEVQALRFDRVIAEAKAQKWTLEKLNVIAEYNMPFVARDEEGSLIGTQAKEPSGTTPTLKNKLVGNGSSTSQSHSNTMPRSQRR